MKITKKKTVEEVIRYHLSDEIKYDITFINKKEKSRVLHYIGKNIFGYSLRPLYGKDISVLKKWNPCWGDSKKMGIDEGWLYNNILPDPDNIDLSKIIFVQNSTHSFFTIDKKPIPVVVQGDYIEALLNNKYYDLEKLKKHLVKHKNIVRCSEITSIPYYNREDDRDSYLSVLVYPTQKSLQYAYDNNERIKNIVFTQPWDKKSPDMLGLRKFQIRNEY
jgi:hypothetical protein